jgi:glycosyltransferase involved in cell wall biosynthesis
MMIPLIYALKTGELGSVELMALATLDGLRDEFIPYVLAPEGAVLKEAREQSLLALPFANTTDFLLKLRLILAANPEIGFIATDYRFSYLLILLNFFYRRKITHLFLVEEESLEQLDSSRRSKLSKCDVTFVAHSRSIREKLIAHGIRQEKIRVIENFLTEKNKEALPRRSPFHANGVTNVVVVSKIEPEKKVGLLLDALDLEPALAALEFTIYGSGSQLDELKRRAAGNHPNVTFAGTCENSAEKLAGSDLLVNFCANESNGLTVLEAMAADVPVLVPHGGPEAFITHNINGFSFKADDARDLARRLRESSNAPSDLLNSVTKGGRYLLNIKFSSESGVERYRRLLNEQKVQNVDLSRGKLIL